VEPDDQGRPRSRHRQITLPGTAPFGAAETAEFAFRREMTVGDFVAMLGIYSGVIAG
jgi:hypothetical protein